MIVGYKILIVQVIAQRAVLKVALLNHMFAIVQANATAPGHVVVTVAGVVGEIVVPTDIRQDIARVPTLCIKSASVLMVHPVAGVEMMAGAGAAEPLGAPGCTLLKLTAEQMPPTTTMGVVRHLAGVAGQPARIRLSAACGQSPAILRRAVHRLPAGGGLGAPARQPAAQPQDLALRYSASDLAAMIRSF